MWIPATPLLLIRIPIGQKLPRGASDVRWPARGRRSATGTRVSEGRYPGWAPSAEDSQPWRILSRRGVTVLDRLRRRGDFSLSLCGPFVRFDKLGDANSQHL